jgi:hypothetical protein
MACSLQAACTLADDADGRNDSLHLRHAAREEGGMPPGAVALKLTSATQARPLGAPAVPYTTP